jgi:hypothetical protein
MDWTALVKSDYSTQLYLVIGLFILSQPFPTVL